MINIQNFYEHGNAKNPKQIIFLLHGLGSNGQDLISLAPLWQSSVPDALFISPDAPFACDMMPPGYPNSFQWFSLQNRDRAVVGQGIKTAFPILQHFMQQQCLRLNVPLNKTALVGFSQGTMMSLYTAPRLNETIAGVLGYSGALFGEDALIQDPDEFVKPPVHLIHGEADDVVPVDRYTHARDSLQAAGFTVTGHTTPGLTHSIDEKGIKSGGDFLAKVFA
jgi:phospholipase/carboxylesterase